MKIFFDMEFTGLRQNTTLISIGLISEEGHTFYAETNYYDTLQVSPWIKENVISNLTESPENRYFSKGDLRKALLEWLDQFDYIEWVSDCCHYDFVLLIDLLFGDALSIPKKYGTVCYDINQLISDDYCISLQEAFDKSREEILDSYGITYISTKHNALYDAKVIRKIYQCLMFDTGGTTLDI